MTTINVVTVTQAQDFPAGTVDTTYDFQLVNADGSVADATSSAEGTTTFPNVAPGVYTVKVTKNGVTVTSDPVTVVQPGITLQVPTSLTVSQV